MSKINLGRVLLGGLVAGIISAILGYLVDGILLSSQWADGMKALGAGNFSSTQWAYFSALSLIGGIVAIWFYAAIRPRFGAGIKTAVIASIACWVLTSLLPNLSFMWFGGLFAHQLTVLTTLGNLVEIVAGVVAGAALYQEA